MSRAGEKVHNKKVFKPYNQNQLMIPMSFEMLIPKNHQVRVVNSAIDKMNINPLLLKYPGGGRSSFNPIMMLKLVVYAYTDRIFSSRRIGKAARENVMYMWLCGGNTPDFMTINRFRSERMKDIIIDVFAEVVELLVKEKYIKLENYFLDGTKIQANANKNSWVWGKATKRYKEALREKCKKLFEEINKINEEENEEYGDNDLEELGNDRPIDSAAIEETVKRINERLEKTKEEKKPSEKTKKLKKAKRVLEKDYLPRMKGYEDQEAILEERNSYSKTDKDATFMKMKEDLNGKPKPGYNVQIGTENQFVVGLSIHQRPGDANCLKGNIKILKKILRGKLPESLTADGAYGSEENYEYLEEQEIEHFVKFSTFHKELSKEWKEDKTRVQNFKYIKEKDEYVCFHEKHLVFKSEHKTKNDNGYESTIRIYQGTGCAGCPDRERCIKSEKPEANRTIYVNRKLNMYKDKARKQLCSAKGLEMRSLRPVEVESVFGDIKGNIGIRRFLLKGLEKVFIEWALHCIGHNMRKMAALAT